MTMSYNRMWIDLTRHQTTDCSILDLHVVLLERIFDSWQGCQPSFTKVIRVAVCECGKYMRTLTRDLYGLGIRGGT
jgi:hypothetical protein